MNTAQHLDDDVLNAWLDHALPGVEQGALEAHLSQCARCRREAEELSALKAALAALPEAEPPRSFRLTPQQAERATSASPVHMTPVLRLLPVVRSLSIAAVMALLIVSGALMLGPSGDDDAETAGSETATLSESSMRQSALPRGGSPGEITDEGETASVDSETFPEPAAAAPVLGEASEQESLEIPSTQAEAEADEDLSPLAIATIGLGAASIVLLGLWLVLSRMNQPPART